MAANLKDIQAPISSQLKEFERKFRESMASDVPLLDKIMHYIVQKKGKQLRPLLVLLSAAVSGEITESTYRSASFVEMIHTATLVHDDVVDESYQRRGFFSINALWKNKIAVLVGDYLFSRSLLLATDHKEYELLQILNLAVKKMSEGELMQMDKTRKLNITEEQYYHIISQKTASFIAAACEAGSASAGASEEHQHALHLFGENMGMAFQIKDDLFDYGTDKIGKPKGIDIQEKKMTLPLIRALSLADKKTQKKILKLVKNHKNKKDKIQQVIDFVKESDGLDYTRERMLHYQELAREQLTLFPDSEYKAALSSLLDFVAERKK